MVRLLKTLPILLAALLALLFCSVPVQAADKAELDEIRRLEALLMVPCDEPLAHMNELVRLGQAYQEQEQQRLALYRSTLDAHRLVLAPFVIEADAKTGVTAGAFRARYDQLYQEADQEGLLRGAGFEEIPSGRSMADMAAQAEEYPEHLKQLYAGESYGTVGSWSKRQEGLGNQLFFVEAQRQTAERLRKEMMQLKAEWMAARAEYIKRMAADPFKEAFAELEKRAGLMTGTLRREYEANSQALTVEAQSGDYVHCLGEIIESSSYTVVSEGPGLVVPHPYKAGEPGTVEALPGMGFRMAVPAPLDKIQSAEKSIPEEFPLDLPLKYDPQIYIKTEIERLQIQVKAERDAIIAMGTYLTGLEGTAGRIAGETFNVFHGLCEGFAGVGNILIGIGKAQLHPIDTLEKLASVKDSMINLIANPEAAGEAAGKMLEKGLVTTVDFFRGIGSGVELMARDAPPEGVYDRASLAQWKRHAENTRLARETLTNVEKLAGNILADVATAGLSKLKVAKLAVEAADTAGDMARVAAQAKKLGFPDAKTLDNLGDGVRKSQDELQQVAKELTAPKPRDIPYSQQVNPSPREVLAKAAESTSQGGMNSYVKLNDDLGMKVSKQPLIKGDSADAVLSRKARDLDDAGRTYVEDITKDSTLGRLPQVKERYYIVGDGAGGVKKVSSLDEIPNGAPYKTVDVVENIPPSTHASTLAEQGKLTADHVRAYEAFMRDMNAKGYVWTDNKVSNFAFEAVDEAKGIYRVVPLDTGGFYKVGDLPAGVNMSKADFARKVQTAYDRGAEANVEGALSKYAATVDDMVKQGIPETLNVDEVLGVSKINPKAQEVVNTWDSGLRISSPNTPHGAYYSQVAGKSDDVLARELSDATEASLAGNPDYAKALASRDAQTSQLAEALAQQKKMMEMTTVERKAAQAAAAPPAASAGKAVAGSAVDPLAAAAVQQAAVEVQAAQAKIQCLAVKEKILAGLTADWLSEAWAQCQKLGLTFEGAR